MNTKDLQAYVAVIDTGSIVAAAERLHLTQPGITRRVQSLESMLGVTLLDRQSKPLKATLAGRDVYNMGRRVLTSIDNLIHLVSPQAETSGELRLGVPPFLSEVTLTTPLDSLRTQFPKLSVCIKAAWSPDLMNLLEANAIDAAAVIVPDGVPASARFQVHILGREAALVVAARSMKLPKGDLALADLSPYSWVLNQDGCGLRSAIRHALEAQHQPFSVAVETFGTELQLSLVARGIGIGITTSSALKRSAFRKQIRVLSIPEFENGISVRLLHAPDLSNGRLAAPLACLRDSLAESLREQGIVNDNSVGSFLIRKSHLERAKL